MAKLFDSVKMSSPKRNKFDLSHERKFSFNMGDLIPIMNQEIIPGDSFRVNTEIMMRLAPMLAPIMHRVNVKTEYFFVPYRLLWDEWEDFITGGRLGTSAPVFPNMSVSDLLTADNDLMDSGSLCDYLGLPSVPDQNLVDGGVDGNFASTKLSVLALRAYQLIYSEYYRDQNLTAEVVIPKTSGSVGGGDELTMLTTLRKRCWEKDYSTSALPFAQRGPSVGMPVDVIVDHAVVTATGLPADIGAVTTDALGNIEVDAGATQEPGQLLGSNATTNINDLRRSIRLQEWLEKAARVGARYAELIKGFFGIKYSDARLQRPEYLGGGVTPVRISEVLSTVQQVDEAGINKGNPQGDLTGHGVSVGNQNGFKRFFEEHGVVIGLISVLPKTAYQQGIHRMWFREDKYDYFWTQFANIGEQEVKNKEIFYNALTEVVDDVPFYDETFGYQSRYSEYKYGCSSVHGDFRGNLAFWHMGRIFEDVALGIAAPVLNQSYVESDPTHRIFAVDDPTVHKLWCHLYHRVDALRPMPYFGTPTL